MLLMCRGCETIFYWRSAWDDQDFDIVYNPELKQDVMSPNVTTHTYPSPQPKDLKPDWAWQLYKIDGVLAAIMQEVYTATAAQCFILASVGLRTALDRCTEILKIDPAKTMMEKVDELRANGFIGDTEKMTLDIVADAGNAAAHRAWSPDAGDFKSLLSTLEQFMGRTIIAGTGTLALATKIPAKPKRIKS